jgi:hypothetical protein
MLDMPDHMHAYGLRSLPNASLACLFLTEAMEPLFVCLGINRRNRPDDSYVPVPRKNMHRDTLAFIRCAGIVDVYLNLFDFATRRHDGSPHPFFNRMRLMHSHCGRDIDGEV